MPSVSEVARKAGVSKSTVSLVLNNRSHVSEPMRQRVLQALAELQAAEPARAARPVRTARVLLIHPISMGVQQVFREMLQGVEQAVEEASGRLTLAAHHPPLRPEHTTSALLHDPALRPNGVLVMGAIRDDPIFEEVRKEGLPCVLLARQECPSGFSSVGMDDREGAREAVEHLVRLGHRRIAFIGGDPAYEYTGFRLQGYRAALEGAGLYNERLALPGDVGQAVSKCLQADPRPTAIFFVNDNNALAGLPIIRDAGLRIPQDFSVVSFDDTHEIATYDPPVTTVHIPRREIGALAARALIDHIRYPHLKSVKIILRTHLVVRGSTAPPQA